MPRVAITEEITEEDIARAILSSLGGRWPQDEKELLILLNHLDEAGRANAPGK